METANGNRSQCHADMSIYPRRHIQSPRRCGLWVKCGASYERQVLRLRCGLPFWWRSLTARTADVPYIVERLVPDAREELRATENDYDVAVVTATESGEFLVRSCS